MSYNRKGRIQAEEDGEDATLRLSPERQEKRARNVLLHQLNRSVKSKEQLRKILAKREIDVEIAERILDRFEEAGLINDREVSTNRLSKML
jgi:SOS response regulatory protein OraA/RecX